MFDHTVGHHTLVKFLHKINHHTYFPLCYKYKASPQIDKVTGSFSLLPKVLNAEKREKRPREQTAFKFCSRPLLGTLLCPERREL